MASCGLKVWCIKQSRGIQGYTGIYIYTHIRQANQSISHLYNLTHLTPRLEGGGSQGDVPTLIRFGGGLNALAPILTSWTAFGACSACGPCTCPSPSYLSCARGSPGHLSSSSSWVYPHLNGLMQIASAFWRTSPHSTLASQVHRRIRPLRTFPHASWPRRRTAVSAYSSGVPNLQAVPRHAVSHRH